MWCALAVTAVFVCSTEVCVLIRLPVERTRASVQKHTQKQRERGWEKMKRERKRQRLQLNPNTRKEIYLNYI